MMWYNIEFGNSEFADSENFVLDFIKLICESKSKEAILYENKAAYTIQFIICVEDHNKVFFEFLEKHNAKECEINDTSMLIPLF